MMRPIIGSLAEPPLEHAQEHALLDSQRERAERVLNGVRAGVLLLLLAAALAYAPTLSPALNLVNAIVLAAMLFWTGVQYILFYRRDRIPGWISLANPIADVAGVTAIMLGYGVAAGAPLALKSPMLLAYFVILAGRPIASSTRRAALVAVLVVLCYAGLAAFFVLTGRIGMEMDPVAASQGGEISLLDEGVKLLLLAVAGAVAAYATRWHEQVATSYARTARTEKEMQVRLSEARLEALKLQLQPHFLFNTLNTISALIHTDPDAAERMIHGLSELIRMALRTSALQEVPLRYELEVLGYYMAIQRIRFGDRLTMDIQVDPSAEQALIPNLLLQPIVENAIKHGLSSRAAAGHVDVSARRHDGTLRVRVSDNGVGFRGADPTTLERVGIGNARARLRHLYGDAHEFRIQENAGGGVVVEIALPFREASDQATSPPSGSSHPRADTSLDDVTSMDRLAYD